MTGITLILGGARSGKSRHAVELAQSLGPKIVYVATCRKPDAEMRRRIARHRRERPAAWITLELPDDLPTALVARRRAMDGVLLDCLTLYVAALATRFRRDATVEREVQRLCVALAQLTCPVLVVSNEVGAGVVPEHPLGRRFRDLAGWANQAVARRARRVLFMVAGVPLVIKQEAAHAVA